MNRDKILDYIMTTPHNINWNVLSSMLGNGDWFKLKKYVETTSYNMNKQVLETFFEEGGSSSGEIYGAEWAGDTSSAWTRTDAAASFADPSPAVANGTGSSPFDNIMPWSGMRRVSDPVAGELVEIPKYWYKWTRDGAKMKLQIANEPIDGFFVSPAHADRGDGVGERDVVYVGRYHCADDYKSKTGVEPVIRKTRDQFRQGISALGTGIYQYDFAMYWTIAMLYIVEFADWNSQAKIGYGCGSVQDTIQNEGATDVMQYHTGTNAASRDTYGEVQYRYIEGLWSNVYDFVDGIYFNNTDVYCIKNPADFSDNTGGTLVGTRSNSNGIINEFINPTANGFEYALYPNSVDGGASETEYVTDACAFSASGVVLFVGGYHYDRNQGVGLFFMLGVYPDSHSGIGIGSRLMKLA